MDERSKNFTKYLKERHRPCGVVWEAVAVIQEVVDTNLIPFQDLTKLPNALQFSQLHLSTKTMVSGFLG